jgi:hypothetical protein
MGFMKRVFGGEPEPGPGWASPMSSAQAERLVGAVEGELQRRGLTFETADGAVRVWRGDASGQPSEYGLTNLAQVCHQVDAGEWSAIVSRHFDNLFAAEDEDARLDAIAVDLDAVRSMLKVRLFPGPGLGGFEPRPPVSWELAPGITAAFVYDLPTTVRTVGDTHIAAWGLDHGRVLAVALDNVRGDAVDMRPLADGGASAPVACVADHFFAASHALLLEERLPAAAQGAIFAVPHRHALLYAPIVDLGIIESINRVIATGVSLFQQGPGSISPGLYWWRSGTVSLLPSQFDGRKIDFAPPDEFVAVLNGLQAPA